MAQAKAVPTFKRQVYDAAMRRETRQIPACECGSPLPKSTAKAAVCANCGGAILTEIEKTYMRSLGRTEKRFQSKAIR